MAKYINREELVAWLQHIPLKDLSDGRGLCRIITEEDFKRAIRTVPEGAIVDLEPVVYCRHCRSYNKPRLGWCSVHLDREGPDDFCGYGARMDDGACNQVCKYNTPDRGCVAGELGARCDLANVTGERGNGEAG